MVRVVLAVGFLVSALIGTSPSAASGTAELVADINQVPSFGSSSYGASEPLIPLGDRLLFTGIEPSSGAELWISDATPQGTRLLLDLEPGGESASFTQLGKAGQTAVLLRRLRLGNWTLWRSDGTAAGTFPLDDLRLDSCIFAEDPEAAGTEDGLFFLARNGFGASCGLRITDGTAAGTRLVEDLGGEARHLVAAGNRVFFVAGSSLWTSDGDGATLLRSFESEDSEGPRQLYAAGSRVVFVAQALEGAGEELWTSDGTTAGTRALTSFFEPLPFGFEGTPLLRLIGQTLYFTADDGTGTDLWRIEGFQGPPRRVTDFINSSPFPQGFDESQIARIGNRLVFPAIEGGGFRGRLWTSGGTPESTAPVNDCPEGCPSLSGSPLIQLGSRIVFEGI